MTLNAAPICVVCEWFKGYHKRTGTCTAFPDGIPTDIWTSQFDHRQPHDGDNDTQFAPKTPEDSDYPDLIFRSETIIPHG